ncbi:MAG: hypothetical protein HKN88_10505 [Gammaproteobacteria bacterium]|nr:hypothetical protein [Gammaproteobacteria bacterium]NNC98486.1 hypothetical protein [Gammaproteobacteria bacterium]NNM13099.1 hypothetical protein [Gammaproteobacteria bacterium]
MPTGLRKGFFYSCVSTAGVFLSFASLQAQEVLCEGAGEVIQSIEFNGLETTRRRVVDRQLSIQVGELLDCQSLHNSTQAITDLGLFKKVHAKSQLDDKSVHVTFDVIEKRYLIVLPYVASSESGSINYGLRGRWSNIGGLNQRASLNLRTKTFSTDLKDEETKATISFSSPQIRNTDFDARFDFGYIDLSTREIGSLPDSTPFNEVSRYSSLGISRWFHRGQRQHGWQLGGVLKWRSWTSDNPTLRGSVDAEQSLLGLGLSVKYDRIHDHTYSYSGFGMDYRVEPTIALDGERNPTTQEASGIWHIPYGAREHSQFEIKSGLGWSNGAYPDFVPFENSLSAQLRGISYPDFEGDRYYYLKASYLTPYTFAPFKRTRLAAYPSLRAEFFAEVDDIYFKNGQRGLKGTAWSVGTGVRWRLPWFVGVQVGAGIAYHSEEDGIGFYISGR